MLGESGSHDLVDPCQRLQSSFQEMRESVQQAVEQLDSQLAANEQRLDRTISKTAVVRYDAYNEMSGRQSTSMALLDEEGTGIVMSSILHRDQARLYVKGVRAGEPEYELSPEEDEAVRIALAGEPAGDPAELLRAVAFLGPEGTFSEEALLASPRGRGSSRFRWRRSSTA